jgi:cyclic pyranopterin phosphate synthase
MARDSFDREIDYLRISVTDKCDLACVYCGDDVRPRKDGCATGTSRPEETAPMTLQEAAAIVRAAVSLGVRKVRITGGEPLVRTDILELVRALSGAGVMDLSLTTNGLRLPELARPLREAGLNRLNISLDSMDPDRYGLITGGGDLQRALKGIASAEAAGLDPVKINMVPMRGVNDDEIPLFARMTLERPVHIRFIEYMPAGRKGQWERGKCVTSDEARAMVQESVGPLIKRPFKGKGPSRNYRFEGAPGIVGFISALSHSFCYSCNRLRVTSRGRARPCLFSNTEIDLLGPIRKGAGHGEIARLLEVAVATKPEGNYLAERPEDASIGPMSEIGG